MNTVLGLLIKGDVNCAGAEINPNRDIFGQDKQPVDPSTTAGLHDKPRTAGEIAGKGVVLTQAEKEAAEEERRRKEEEEERLRREEEERLRREEEERRRNSFGNRTMRSLKNFFKTLVSPDED